MAYSGLTDEEMRQVDAIVRKTIRESFGPVRSVEPTLVFELGFEGISRSPRHKSGIAVRFPRMLRWRRDKPIAEADTVQTLTGLLPLQDQVPGGKERPEFSRRRRRSAATKCYTNVSEPLLLSTFIESLFEFARKSRCFFCGFACDFGSAFKSRWCVSLGGAYPTD